ncbi:hypothetical protein EKK58_03090 [Candidatus Dependentiae bacterium]|nr:MAG: hypothetical protein EKK58_03090 [Candidatus Dependentiae bacterium]
MATCYINNKTNQDLEVIFKYEGHGKVEEQKITLKPNESKEYAGFIPGCLLTSITCSTVANNTTNKQTAIIKNQYGNFDITFSNGFLTVNQANY